MVNSEWSDFARLGPVLAFRSVHKLNPLVENLLQAEYEHRVLDSRCISFLNVFLCVAAECAQYCGDTGYSIAYVTAECVRNSGDTGYDQTGFTVLE